jgi:hypothetical protein
MLLILTALAGAQGQADEQKIKPSQLPPAVKQAIKDNCGNCLIAKATREVENGVTLYDLEFKRGRGEMDVTEDGSVINRETVVKSAAVPKPALAAIRKAAAGGRIKLIERDEVRAELKDGNVVKLDPVKYLYEADLVKGNRVAEVQVTPEGQVVEPPKWRKKGAKED